MEQKYPIGIQDFLEVRVNNYLYIDKTESIYKVTSVGKYNFLSRPRRFGKSLLVSTLDYLFKGRKDLFTGLFIEDKWDWSKKNPVIKISFSNIGHKYLGLKDAIDKRLNEIAQEFEISLTATTIDQKFKEIIEILAKNVGKVVVLIDEYDKPIIDYLGTDTAKAVENRDVMKAFYSILKDADPHLQFVFITGVSKFARVSIFSDLNNLLDLTIDNRMSGICGITQIELEHYFAEELKEFDINQIKIWYNGYTWDLKTRVYNPFSLLNFFIKKQFQNFWFETGTPTFLINLTKELQLFDFDKQETSLIHLSTFDIENIDLIPLMFQTGYLTFKDYDEIGEIYTLGFPNKEVKKSYLEILLDAYTSPVSGKRGIVMVNELRKLLIANDLERLQSILNTLYQSIPYTLWQKDNEAYYHAIIHLTFNLLGIYVDSEIMLSDGRIDTLVRLEKYVYCFEFKLDVSVDEALTQIKQKGYLQPYLNSGKECIAIGVNFSKELKKIAEIKWESVN